MAKKFGYCGNFGHAITEWLKKTCDRLYTRAIVDTDRIHAFNHNHDRFYITIYYIIYRQRFRIFYNMLCRNRLILTDRKRVKKINKNNNTS